MRNVVHLLKLLDALFELLLFREEYARVILVAQLECAARKVGVFCALLALFFELTLNAALILP